MRRIRVRARARKAKRNLVPVVSHQFGTPLTVILGFSELILNEPLSLEEIREYAADIHEEATRLSLMISQMRDLDRMEAGEVRLNREPMDLNRAIAAAAGAIRPHAPNHTIELVLDPAVETVQGDRDRLSEAITYLVNTALKHSPEGGTVVITSQAEGDTARVSIRDQGDGIPPEALGQVFERFSRVDSVASRSFKGTGLGLALARQVVLMHGGKIWAESTPGQGSAFPFTLPVDGLPRAHRQ